MGTRTVYWGGHEPWRGVRECIILRCRYVNAVQCIGTMYVRRRIRYGAQRAVADQLKEYGIR